MKSARTLSSEISSTFGRGSGSRPQPAPSSASASESLPGPRTLFLRCLPGVGLQVLELAVGERRLVRRLEHDLGRYAGLEGLLPARRAQAPLVAGLQAGESGTRRREVVAARLGERQELGCHPDAHRVHAEIVGARATRAVAIEARHRIA